MYNHYLIASLPDLSFLPSSFSYQYIFFDSSSSVFHGIIATSPLYFNEQGNISNSISLSVFSAESALHSDSWINARGPYELEIGSFSSAYPLVYSNIDVYTYDNVLSFSGSASIPLDGFTVLEWDGDSSSMVESVESPGFYRIDDYFMPSSVVSVLKDSSFGLTYSICDQLRTTDLGWSVVGDSSADISSIGHIEENGVFLWGLNSSSYTQLFAYRESETEGPTGAVTGLTITNPPLTDPEFTAYAGTEIQCTAQVTGTGDYNSSVTWSVSYSADLNLNSYPTISETGLLRLPADMVEQRIFVIATSVQDNTIQATVPVYVYPPAVSSVTVSPSSATAAPGQNIQFTASVTGSNVTDPDVTWQVAGRMGATTITRDGLLLIGSDETSNTLVVRAVSNQDGSVYGIATVTVTIPASVTGVTISPDDIVLNRGDIQQFTATVTGTGSYVSTVTWQITSVYSAGTSISDSGLLTIGEEQKYDYIIIKATSTADPSQSATAYVFVEDALSDPMNIDLSVVERLLEEIKNYLKTLQHIFDRPHYFREFNMYTGQLSEQEEQITGITFNFYRFMQNMEEYVGSLAYTFANGAEVQIRNDTTEGFDWFSLFFGKDSNTKVEKTDFAGVSTIISNTRDLFDTGFGFSDFFELITTVPFFTDEVGASLDTTPGVFDMRDPDPFNMSVLNNRSDQLDDWREKHAD